MASCISLARRSSVRSGTAPDSEITRIGNSEKLISSMVGCLAPSGNSAWAWLTRSRTSARVADLSQPNSNSITTTANPSPAVAVILSRPSTSRSRDSSGLTSSFSASVAEMPG
jgi:hypothetical protein